MVAPVRPRTVSTGEKEEKSANVFSRSARAAARDSCQSPRAGWGVSLVTPARKTNNRDQRKQPALIPSSSLTIGNHDASDHGSKHNSQRQGLEAQRGHVAPGSEGAVLLLGGQGWGGELALVFQSPDPQQFPQQCSLQLQPIPAVIPSLCPSPQAGTQRTAQCQGQEEGAQGCSRREKLQRKSSGCARERCSPTALGAGPSPAEEQPL